MTSRTATVDDSTWRKARASAQNGGCVEAGSGPGVVGVRDTKQHGRGPVLAFTPAAWREFTTRIKAAAR